MKRHRHRPKQAVRKLQEGERLLNEGKDMTEVLRHLEIAGSTWRDEFARKPLDSLSPA